MTDVVVLGEEQLACLASPVRNAALMRLRQVGQASARELGESLGKSTEAMHYHMKALLKVGLIREAFKRPAPKKPESVYEPIGRNLRLPPPNSSPALRALSRKAVLAGLRQTSRGFQAASERGDVDAVVASRTHVIRANLSLTDADYETFLGMLQAASRFAEEHRTDSGSRLHWSSIAYSAL